jgi:hypothetical protein
MNDCSPISSSTRKFTREQPHWAAQGVGMLDGALLGLAPRCSAPLAKHLWTVNDLEPDLASVLLGL